MPNAVDGVSGAVVGKSSTDVTASITDFSGFSGDRIQRVQRICLPTAGDQLTGIGHHKAIQVRTIVVADRGDNATGCIDSSQLIIVVDKGIVKIIRLGGRRLNEAGGRYFTNDMVASRNICEGIVSVGISRRRNFASVENAIVVRIKINRDASEWTFVHVLHTVAVDVFKLRPVNITDRRTVSKVNVGDNFANSNGNSMSTVFSRNIFQPRPNRSVELLIRCACAG